MKDVEIKHFSRLFQVRPCIQKLNPCRPVKQAFPGQGQLLLLKNQHSNTEVID